MQFEQEIETLYQTQGWVKLGNASPWKGLLKFIIRKPLAMNKQ